MGGVRLFLLEVVLLVGVSFHGLVLIGRRLPVGGVNLCDLLLIGRRLPIEGVRCGGYKFLYYLLEVVS